MKMHFPFLWNTLGFSGKLLIISRNCSLVSYEVVPNRQRIVAVSVVSSDIFIRNQLLATFGVKSLIYSEW